MNDHHHAAAGGSRLLTPEELRTLDDRITRGRMDRDIRRYAGIHSRHVSHMGNWEAVLRLYLDLFRIGGGRLHFRPQHFTLPGTQDVLLNVEATLPGVCSSHVVIISAHLDSTGTRDPAYRPRRDPAPGADDDASGIAGVLAAARAIIKLSQAQRPGSPRAEIRFVLFNAEEQGQRGSRVYAKRERQLGTRINAVYHMDMIGFRPRRNDTFELHAGFRKDPDVQDASLDVAHHLVEVCAAARVKLTPQIYFHRAGNRDPGQGFSDHTSFHRRGFPAVLISEDFFPSQGLPRTEGHPNVNYHTPDDLPDILDPGYAATIARAVTAAAWHRATRIGCGPVPRTARQNGRGTDDEDDDQAEDDDR